MVTNVSTTVTPNPKLSISSRAPSPSPARVKRAPLLPSESDNNVPLPRKPKPRDVSSRYLSSTASISTTMTSTSSSGSFSSTTTTTSSSTSNSNYNYNSSTPRRRFPSPLVSSTNLMTPSTVTVNNKRAQSTERRRPKTPTVTAKMLTALPARNLSVSFQGPSFAVPLNKVTKPPPNNINNNNNSNNNNNNNNNINRSRNSTPDKRPVTPVRKLGNNNSSSSNNNNNSVDQKRWPAARSRPGSFMTRSVDFTNENIKLSGSGTATAIRERISKDKDNKHEIPEVNRSIDKLISDFNNNADRVVSDAESVSSGSTTPSTVRGGRARGITVPARFMQETVNRLRRVQPEPVSPPLRNNRPVSGNRYLRDGPVQSPRGLSPSPVRGAVRPASPCKSVPLGSAASPARGMASPTRGRSAIGSSGNLGNPHSILSFAAESRRRKVGDNAINDAHVLRMLHNKYLQWRFANARADGAMLVKRATAQKSLYNSWVTTSKMRQSVISKRMEIQQLRQNLKLYTVLKTKMSLLKVWDQVERDHIVSLSGTIGSLESTTLRVPLVDGAKVDVQSLKDAMRSAADVMQAVASLIRSLVTKVEHVNALASELASTTTNERSALDQCKDLLSILTHMEVQDCSVRTHVLQLQPPSSTALTEL